MANTEKQGWPTQRNRGGQAVANVVNPPPLATPSSEGNPFKLGWPKGGQGVAIAGREARQGFLLSTLLLWTPWTMNGELTQNPNSGEARYATRQGSHQFYYPTSLNATLTHFVNILELSVS